MASTKEECSEAGRSPAKPKSKLAEDWQAFTYDEIRELLEGIVDFPGEALDAMTTAAFLCASMPGPVRAAWKAAATPVDNLIAALLLTSYGRDCARMLWEVHRRFERARYFRLVVSCLPPTTVQDSNDPYDPDEAFGYSEPVELDSHNNAVERLGDVPVREPDSEENTDTGMGAGQTTPDAPAGAGVDKREHYTDFVVLGVRILEEVECARASEDQRGEARMARSTARRSSLDIMCDVVNMIWSDSAHSDSYRSVESVRRAHQRGLRELPDDFPANAYKPGDPGTSLIKLLEEHRKKRGSLGLGCVWIRR
jgi:hypothetical protein